MTFAAPNFDPNIIELKEGVRYIVPQDHISGSSPVRFRLAKKAINQAAPNFVTFQGVPEPEPGDVVLFFKNNDNQVIFYFFGTVTGLVNTLQLNDNFGDRYFLQTGEQPYSIDFSDKTTPDNAPLAKFWGKISSSMPGAHHGITLVPNSQNEIYKFYNRINLGKLPPLPGASDFTQFFFDFGQGPQPAPTALQQILTASAIPVTAAKLTNGVASALLVGGNPTEYISENSYHIFSVFHVSSMSNGPTDNMSDNYILFTDLNNKLGVHFKTSSLSDFSPEEQYVDVIFTHTPYDSPTTPVTLSLTASMNALHSLEASYDVNSAVLNFKVDQTATAVSGVGHLDSLGQNMLLGGVVTLPIGPGITVTKNSSVIPSVELVDISFAKSQSSAEVVTAIENYYNTFYKFGEPIAYKTPNYLAGDKFWGRMPKTDLSDYTITTGTPDTLEFLFNKSNTDSHYFTSAEFFEESPWVNTVDAEKPLLGINFSGSLPALRSKAPALSYISNEEYQVYLALRCNKVTTNFTDPSDFFGNEQIFGTEDQDFGILLRQGTGSSDVDIIAIHKPFNTFDFAYVSSSAPLGEINLIDFSYKGSGSSGTLRLQINNQPEVTASNVAPIDLTLLQSKQLLLGMGTNGFFAFGYFDVDSDLLEIMVGNRQINEPERSLCKEYFFGRYSITSSI